MVKSKNRLVAFMLLVMMTLTMFLSSFILVHADYTAVSGNPLSTLQYTIQTGKYTYLTNNKVFDMSKNRYKKGAGGYLYWYELFNTDASSAGAKGSGSAGVGDFFDDTKFDSLSAGAKQDFLSDVFTIANAVASDSANGYRTGDSAPTDDTVTDLMDVIAQQSGMGSSLLATLLENTKPNYVSANRLYEPFSGVVGTILGIVSIVIMAALGVTMALDLAYITIPAFQMAMGGSDEQGNGSKGKGIGGFISQEAKSAVKAADGGQGGQSGDGSYKAAVGIYFKYRWKGLVLLGICLLYLVQGQIYSFVSWFIDLFSGFLGF